MREAEKESLRQIAVMEFKKNWPLGLLWLLAIIGMFGLMLYGGYRAIVG